MAAALFVALGALLFGPYLHNLPEGTHVWAQTDRLALAINFYDFGFNFWHPRTSSLQSIGGLTGVEFPLQPYVAALGGLVFGRGSITTVFRVLDAAAAVLGCWYLFRLVFERTGSFAAGLLPGAFLLTAPTYAFYASSPLPDPFSFSLTLVGYYYWLHYFEPLARPGQITQLPPLTLPSPPNRFADLPRALLFLTLAALIKTTSGLHLAAVVGITLLYALLEPAYFTHRQRVQLLLTLAVSAGLLIGFYLHNLQLNVTYQSHQFLAAAMPADGVVTWHEYLRAFRGEGGWRYEYLTHTQYRVLLVSLVLCLVLARRGWRQQRPLVLLLLASLVNAFLFYQLMGALMAVHDYYAICSFLPPVVLVLVLALVLTVPLVRAGRVRYVFTGGLLVLVSLLVRSSFPHLASRMSDDYPPLSLGYTYRWMRGGASLLQQAGVPLRARVLAPDDYSSNMPLVYFDRRGRTGLDNPPITKVAELERRMSADSLDYVIMQPDTYARLAPEQAVLDAAFEPVVQQPVVVLRRRHPHQVAW